MKLPRLLLALTVVNLALLVFLLVRLRPLPVRDGGPVLRGRALQIVDDRGKVRAGIVVHPEDPSHTLPDGTPNPETVMLRLVDPNGRPSVKLGTSVRGAGIALGGETDATFVVMKSEGAESSLRMTAPGGRQQLIKP